VHPGNVLRPERKGAHVLQDAGKVVHDDGVDVAPRQRLLLHREQIKHVQQAQLFLCLAVL